MLSRLDRIIEEVLYYVKIKFLLTFRPTKIVATGQITFNTRTKYLLVHYKSFASVMQPKNHKQITLLYKLPLQTKFSSTI